MPVGLSCKSCTQAAWGADKEWLQSTTYLLRVFEVLEESLIIPNDALVDVGGGVGEAFRLASLAAEDAIKREKSARSQNKIFLASFGEHAPMQVRADLVWATSLNGVALGTTGLEEGLALANVTYSGKTASAISAPVTTPRLMCPC